MRAKKIHLSNTVLLDARCSYWTLGVLTGPVSFGSFLARIFFMFHLSTSRFLFLNFLEKVFPNSFVTSHLYWSMFDWNIFCSSIVILTFWKSAFTRWNQSCVRGLFFHWYVHFLYDFIIVSLKKLDGVGPVDNRPSTD